MSLFFIHSDSCGADVERASNLGQTSFVEQKSGRFDPQNSHLTGTPFPQSSAMISSQRSRHSKQTETVPSPRTFNFGAASLPQKLHFGLRTKTSPRQFDTLVADVHAGPSDQLRNIFLSLSTEAANEHVQGLSFAFEARAQESRRLTLLDLPGLYGLWVEHYDAISEEGRNRRPLKAVYYLDLPD